MPKKPYEPYAPDFRAALRVKVKSLADEAKIIRREEHRARSWHEWMSLKSHRKFTVRREARAAQLALAFLRGMSYELVEPGVRSDNPAPWKRVQDLVLKYSVPPHKALLSDVERKDILKRLKEWAPSPATQWTVTYLKAA